MCTCHFSILSIVTKQGMQTPITLMNLVICTPYLNNFRRFTALGTAARLIKCNFTSTRKHYLTQLHCYYCHSISIHNRSETKSTFVAFLPFVSKILFETHLGMLPKRENNCLKHYATIKERQKIFAEDSPTKSSYFSSLQCYSE